MSAPEGDRWTLRLDGSPLPDRELIGGKAWSIARMLAMGLNVPPAFVVTTDACRAYMRDGDMPAGLVEEIDAGILWLEGRTGRRFASGPSRLLLSVRSGAAISMPGMMDTVLNLGIDEEGEAALAAETGQPAFARDTHRRFHELYAAIVLKESGADMPPSPRAQLHAAVRAVFDSWNARRARRYRQHNNIPDDLGTAVTIQAMVFGNLDDRSGTGVLFSRNPLTGDPSPFGEYLPKAQGEDVVSGKFTPQPLEAMNDAVPDAYQGLLSAATLLERAEGDLQDIEFTVQRGELFLLQARSGKRSPEAAARIAVDMVSEGLISEDVALSRVSADQALAILAPRLAPDAAVGATLLLKGEGACPGVASGVVVTNPEEAEARSAAGEDVILARATTNPDDIHGMIAARGVVTAQGGATSHAAVVSRALGRPCVVGAGDGVLSFAGRVVTVDGSGAVYADRLPVQAPREGASPALTKLIGWARTRSPVQVVSALLSGKAAARGAILSRPDGAKAAYLGGVRTIVTTPVLPALLAILAAVREGAHGDVRE